MKGSAVFLILCAAFGHTAFVRASTSDYNQLSKYGTDRLDIFWKPVKYSQSSIKCFIKHSYNNNAYAQKFLAFNFGYHSLPLLSYAYLNEQPRAYISSVIKLFEKKSKETTFINAFGFVTEFLEKLLTLLAPYCQAAPKDYSHVQEIIKLSLYDFLLTDFGALKRDPEAALEKVSAAASQRIQEADAERRKNKSDISLRALQYDIFHFLELSLGKLIWSAQDQEAVWELVKKISILLAELQQNNILASPEMLDELYWTLLCRFCYFLEIEGAELSELALMTIAKDVADQDLLLLTLPERETYITPKAKYLKMAVMSAQVRSRAFKAGLITDLIPRLGYNNRIS